MKRQVFAHGVLAAFALAAAGCSHVESRSVAFQRFDPRPEAEAEVYVGRAPTRPYVELGLVQAVGTGAEATKQAVLRSLRAQGQQMGCDALVNVDAQAGSLSAHAIGVCAQWAGTDLRPQSPDDSASTNARLQSPDGSTSSNAKSQGPDDSTSDDARPQGPDDSADTRERPAER